MFDRFTPSPGAPLQLVFGADDFGRSSEINGAVERAYRGGLLTSVSLMVTGDAFPEAVALAHRLTGLAVGLHIVLADGRAALPPTDIPHLVDAEGQFPRDPVCAGFRYALLGRRGRKELRRELAAQFERFASTGLPLSHVDGHCHLHVHPAVFPEIVPLAKRYGARGFRLPKDRFRLAARHAPRRAWAQAAGAMVLALLARPFARRLRREGLAVPSRTYGFFESGDMGEDYVVDVLQELREPDAEVYFHPTLGRRLNPLGPNPGDLATLLSPRVRSVIERRGLILTNHLAAGRRR